MKPLVAIDDETICGSPNGKWNMYKHNHIYYTFLNEDINGFFLSIGRVFGNLNAISIGL
jgi:hypothetical protein